MVRIAKRLVRYNIKVDEDAIVRHSSAKKRPATATSVYGKRIQYCCEKCGRTFGAWKHLHQHKVERHSY